LEIDKTFIPVFFRNFANETSPAKGNVAIDLFFSNGDSRFAKPISHF